MGRKNLTALVLFAVVAVAVSCVLGGLADGFTFDAFDWGPSQWWEVNRAALIVGAVPLVILGWRYRR